MCYAHVPALIAAARAELDAPGEPYDRFNDLCRAVAAHPVVDTAAYEYYADLCSQPECIDLIESVVVRGEPVPGETK